MMFYQVSMLAAAIQLSLLQCEGFLQLRPILAPTSSSFTKMLAEISSSNQNTAGSDSLGFSASLSKRGYHLQPQIIFGSNAIEHGVNLIEERTQNVLLLSGWNSARLDPILWELEPRGFKLKTLCISAEPTYESIREVVVASLQGNCGAIIAMGCGSVIETAKLAATLINSNVGRESLFEMTAAELGSALLSVDLAGYPTQEAASDTVLLVTVPALPSLGAELSAVAALRKLTPTRESSVTGRSSPEQQQQQNSRTVSKGYVQTNPPDLCLVQPSLTYRAPMEMVHDRLLGLIATSVDIVLSDPGGSAAPESTAF